MNLRSRPGLGFERFVCGDPTDADDCVDRDAEDDQTQPATVEDECVQEAGPPHLLLVFWFEPSFIILTSECMFEELPLFIARGAVDDGSRFL